MNAVPTDDLRVVKKTISIKDGDGEFRDIFVADRVQRRWLVPDGEPYIGKQRDPSHEMVDTGMHFKTAEVDGKRVITESGGLWQARREEWRDLPEAEL